MSDMPTVHQFDVSKVVVPSENHSQFRNTPNYFGKLCVEMGLPIYTVRDGVQSFVNAVLSHPEKHKQVWVWLSCNGIGGVNILRDYLLALQMSVEDAQTIVRQVVAGLVEGGIPQSYEDIPGSRHPLHK